MSHLHTPTCYLCRFSKDDVARAFTIFGPTYLCSACAARYSYEVDRTAAFLNHTGCLPNEFAISVSHANAESDPQRKQPAFCVEAAELVVRLAPNQETPACEP